MRVIAAVGILVASVLVGAPALAADPYRDAVRRYQTDQSGAVADFAQLTRTQVTDGVRGCLLTGKDAPQLLPCSQMELKAAAMLHADAVDAELGPVRGRAEFDLESAWPILPKITDRVFAARWYAYVARLYLANRDLQAATRIVLLGTQNHQESAELYLTRALITEMPVMWLGDPMSAVLANTIDRRFERTLEGSTVSYQSALRVDPHHEPTRLHLAWNRLLQRDKRASNDLDALASPEMTSETRYLARLFRGLVAERDRDLGSAIAEYEAARRLEPGAQAACTALSHAYEASGNAARAHSVAVECLSSDRKNVDPWWLFRLGLLDRTANEWLHDQVRR